MKHRVLPHYIDIVMKKDTNIGLYKAVDNREPAHLHKLAAKRR